jgi:hypothetical protein
MRAPKKANSYQLSEITALYVARFGEPAAGQRVFIVTRQQKDGWEGFDHETHQIVPEKPADQQAPATESIPSPVAMHKGCTRDAQVVGSQPAQDLGRAAGPVGLSRKPFQAPILGLLLSLCLWLDVSAQEAVPGFVTKLAAEAPMPALAQAAKANHIPLEQIAPCVQGVGQCLPSLAALQTHWQTQLVGTRERPLPRCGQVQRSRVPLGSEPQ